MKPLRERWQEFRGCDYSEEHPYRMSNGTSTWLGAAGPVYDKPDGTRVFYNREGVPHRDGDLPTIEWGDGGREWRAEDGRTHREGGPAYVAGDGEQTWVWDDTAIPPAVGAAHDGLYAGDRDAAHLFRASYQAGWSGTTEELTAASVDLVPLAVEFELATREVLPSNMVIWLDENMLYHRGGGLPAITHPDGSGDYWVHGVRCMPDGTPVNVAPHQPTPTAAAVAHPPEEQLALEHRVSADDIADRIQHWWTDGRQARNGYGVS